MVKSLLRWCHHHVSAILPLCCRRGLLKFPTSSTSFSFNTNHQSSLVAHITNTSLAMSRRLVCNTKGKAMQNCLDITSDITWFGHFVCKNHKNLIKCCSQQGRWTWADRTCEENTTAYFCYVPKHRSKTKKYMNCLRCNSYFRPYSVWSINASYCAQFNHFLYISSSHNYFQNI